MLQEIIYSKSSRVLSEAQPFVVDRPDEALIHTSHKKYLIYQLYLYLDPYLFPKYSYTSFRHALDIEPDFGT